MSDGLRAGDVVLGVHGGTASELSSMTLELQKRLRDGLHAALVAGYAKLQEGGSSLDAVEAAVRVLEDAPEFNAGHGAVFSWEGRNSLDAAVMEGRQKRAGAVAGVTQIKNPVSCARTVLEKSEHVFLFADGAQEFARYQGIELIDPAYFATAERRRELEDVKSGKIPKPHSIRPKQWGTVGAVALDAQGDLAAATSTGGMVGKRFGRVGDTPIIGGGTYADNAAAAVSCTGHGEYFIRFAVAHEIVSQIKYKGTSVEDAVHDVVVNQLQNAGGEGAVIALGKNGDFVMGRNCEGLYRGYVTRDGKFHTFLYDT